MSNSHNYIFTSESVSEGHQHIGDGSAGHCRRTMQLTGPEAVRQGDINFMDQRHDEPLALTATRASIAQVVGFHDRPDQSVAHNIILVKL